MTACRVLVRLATGKYLARRQGGKEEEEEGEGVSEGTGRGYSCKKVPLKTNGCVHFFAWVKYMSKFTQRATVTNSEATFGPNKQG